MDIILHHKNNCFIIPTFTIIALAYLRPHVTYFLRSSRINTLEAVGESTLRFCSLLQDLFKNFTLSSLHFFLW